MTVQISLLGDQYNTLDATADSIVAVPPPATQNEWCSIEKIDSTANTITVPVEGGSRSITLNQQYATAYLISDPSGQWRVQAGGGSGGTAFAAPTGTVGAANADGVAATALRSDATIAHGSGFLPNGHHNQAHGNSDHTGDNQVAVAKSGTTLSHRTVVNFIPGNGVAITVADNSGLGTADVTLSRASSTMYAQTTPNATPSATANTLGASVSIGLDSGWNGIFPIDMLVVTTGVATETITAQVTVTYNDLTTALINVGSITTNTTTAMSAGSLGNLFADGKYITGVALQVKSTIASSAAVVTLKVVGMNTI